MEANDRNPYRMLDLDLASMSEREKEYFDDAAMRYDPANEMSTWQFAWRLHECVVMLRVAAHEARAHTALEVVTDSCVPSTVETIINDVEGVLDDLSHLHRNVAHITRSSTRLEMRIKTALNAIRAELVPWVEGTKTFQPEFLQLFEEASSRLSGPIRTLLTKPDSHGWRTDDDDEGIDCPELSIDRVRRQIRYRGMLVEFKGRKQFAVMELLADAPSSPVSFRSLAMKVWGKPDISRNTLEALISRIRSRIARAGVTGLGIECSGDNYMLVLE